MATLLGGKYCIESLRQDVKDLQSILNEVQSRIGQVKYQSWKFPNKASCDVDVQELLDQYKHTLDDEEDNQMNHVMLYDLVIDRLVFLLQSFICFNEILLNADSSIVQTSPSPLRKKGGSIYSMSVGLSVKKCWARITQIASLMQKMAKKINEYSDQERPVSKQSPIKGDDKIEEEFTISTRKTSPCNHDKDVSCDVRSVGCQTAESAYASCELCVKAQESLHVAGRAVINLCKDQSLPTTLEDYQSRYDEGTPMSVADLLRWSKHQSKDLSRISRHMSNLTKQVNPLKCEVANAKKNEENAKNELKICQSVFDRKAEELCEEFRRKEYVFQETENNLKKKVTTLETIKSNMKEEIESCKWKISELKDELLQKQRDQLSVENSVARLKEESMEGQQYKKDAIKFKNEVTRLNNKLEEFEQCIHHERQMYERERTKNENLEHHEKMLQGKQKGMLIQMESVNEECEKLRERVLALEDELDDVNSKLKKVENSKNSEEASLELAQLKNSELLRESIKALEKENEELQKSVAEYGERERLIVAYPDLNQQNVASPMVQGSGNVVTDMKNQMEANMIRIEILQKENQALTRTLETMKLSNNSPDTVLQRSPSTDRSYGPALSTCNDGHNQSYSPVQLWKRSDIPLHGDATDENTTGSKVEHFSQTHHEPPNFSNGRSYSKWRRSPEKPPSGRKHVSYQAPNRPNKIQEVPCSNGTRVGDFPSFSSTSVEAFRKFNALQGRSSSNAGSSFTVGAGRRPSSRPSSAKNALFKPWT